MLVRPDETVWFNGEKTMGWKSSFGGLTLLLTILVRMQRARLPHRGPAQHLQGTGPGQLAGQSQRGRRRRPSSLLGAPPTLYNLERPIRYLSLAEAVVHRPGTRHGRPAKLALPRYRPGQPDRGPAGFAAAQAPTRSACCPWTRRRRRPTSTPRWPSSTPWSAASMKWVSTDQPIVSRVAEPSVRRHRPAASTPSCSNRPSSRAASTSRCRPAVWPASPSRCLTPSPTCRPAINPFYQPSVAIHVGATLVAGLRHGDQRIACLPSRFDHADSRRPTA